MNILMTNGAWVVPLGAALLTSLGLILEGVEKGHGIRGIFAGLSYFWIVMVIAFSLSLLLFPLFSHYHNLP
jgi:hypothetical protein